MTFEEWTRQHKGLAARDSYDKLEPELDDLQRSLTAILPRYQQQENDLKKMEQEFIRLSKLQAQSSGADADRLNTQLQQIQNAYDRTYQEYAYSVKSYNKAATQASGLLEKYSQYRSTEVSGKAKKDTEYGLGYQDLNYEYINGGSNGVRERIIKQLAAGAYSDREEQGVLHRLSPYQYMTEAEILNYNYIYGRKGKSEANRYLRDLQETLNYRWANNMFEKVKGKPVLELLLGIPAGLEQFGSGMESAMNLLKGDGGKQPVSATQMMSTMIRDDLADTDLKWFDFSDGKLKDANIFGNSLGQVLYDATTTTSNMVPSILASAATNVVAPGVGSYVGLAALGSSAAGNAYQEKLNLGYSQSEATNYAVLVGASESLLQSALGGIGKLGQKTLSKTALNNLSKIDNVLGRVAKKVGSTVGGKLLTSSMSEGFEEGLQAILEPVIWSAVSDEKLDVNAEEVLYSSLLGFMTGGMFEGVELSSDASHVNSQYKQLGEQIISGNGLDSLRALANEMAGVTEGGLQKQLQNQVKKVSGEKVKAADVGRMCEMVQSAVTPETMARLEAARRQQAARNSESVAPDNTMDLKTKAAPEGGHEVDGGMSAPGRTTTETQQGRPLTFQEEVQRQFEEANRPPEKVQKQYDIDEVFSAVQAARNNGSISEERYNDIVETLSYAQSDFAEGSISETEFQGALGTVMRQMGQGYNVSQGTVAATVSATDPLVDVNRDTWQQAQRLAQALGRDIVFYNGAQGENGYYKDGTIYVNIMAQDPFAQVVSHELTHSLEGTKHYDKLKRFVFAQLSKSGVDIAQTRDAKYQQYKRHGKTLENDGAIDAEIVAEYVQTHLLTDEAAITSLVQTEPNVAKRILNWVKNLAARTVGPKAARERAKLDQISRIYAKALQESQGENAQPGAVSVSGQFGGETKIDVFQQSRQQTEADFREGRIGEDEYDAVMDEFDRAENERLGRSLEKYSFGDNGTAKEQKVNDAQKKKTGLADYHGVSLSDDSSIYTYDFLISQPDMAIVYLPDINSIRDYDGRVDTAKVISEGMKNAHSVGEERGGKVYVANRYTGRNLRIDVSSIRHGLNGSMARLLTNGRLGGVIGEIVQNAIPINALKNTADVAVGTYAMAGYATDGNGREFVAIITVEQRTDNVSDISAYDVTHAVSGRQKRSNRLDTKSQGVYPTAAASIISIKDFLGVVKDTYQSILPDDVLNHLGESKNVDGHYYGRAKYSFSDVQTDEQSRRPAEGDYTTDEVEMQARKKGYPVLHGEQVVPFRTWVQTKDQGNYGLVTGLAAENKLLVSFHNKHDGGTADNVAIPYSEVVPVPGAYQMTKEEFASLMASEPLDPGSENLSEEDMRAIEELYHQAKGSEEKAVAPIELEKLPRKAQNYLKRAQRNLLNKLCNGLGVPRAAMQEHLQGVVDDITREYLNSGTISDEKLGELFDKAYSQGIVTDREFYDQYKHIKDYLRATAITISERDKSNIADFQDFRNRQFGRLRIVNKGGLPIDSAYEELRNMAPELFPESITHPADQLVQLAEVARSIAISKKTLDEFYGPEKEIYRSWAKNDFDAAVGDIVGDLYAVRRFSDERAAAGARDSAPTTAEEAEEVYKNLNKARRTYERVSAKNLLTQHDEVLVGRLLRHEMELEHLNPETDNVKGITAVYEAKAEYERLSSLIAKYKRHLHSEQRAEADKYLQTADKWKDKKTGIAYSRETMRRNIYDIIPDRNLARDINEAYFEPVHDAEARAVRMKDDYRNKVRSMNLSRKVDKGNLVSEAHAVQLLGEAEDNIRILENTRGRMQHRDGKTLAEWRAVVMNLWAENPQLDQSKIRGAVQQFREIYDELFKLMNRVRVENGYEPINYRSGYFPHFQPGAADGILAQFGRALGIDTQVVALPTTITGLTHTFKPGIQWFGNAQERLGFNTAYDAVEGFDKYIEGASSVIFQTRNIQRLRAFATQVRYRTSEEGVKERVDAVYEDNRLTDEEKQIKIADIYEHGKYELANFVAELDEYTNLLANKKSKYDRTIEALMGRRSYAFLKWWEGRVGANMIAGNISSALTNFIPLTQAGAQLDKGTLLKGMWQTLTSYKTDDGLVEASTFLTNRRGSDPLVQNWQQKTSAKMGRPMECIDQFVSGSIVRAAYQQNLKRGMSEAEAMHQADIFASGVMADRSKGSMPTLMQASNPLFKMFTQFQLEVNNQFSEVFKDLPRNHMEKSKLHVALVLFRYFLGAWLFNELYERLVGRRAALDPFGILVDAGKDFADPDVGLGEGMQNLASNILGELPYSSGLTLFGFDTDGGRIPASSAVPDLSAIWDAATEKGWSGEKRWKELQDELNKLAYIVPPFGGNQVSKIWKGTKAFIEGGSYSVDAKGNDILQYPVYKDDPWSALGALFRATVLGKSSLPEAQEWVNSGFDGLNAKETAVYQDMLDAGVSQKDAFALLQEIGAAKKTDDLSREEVQRNILRNSNASNEAKAIAYYGILASTERDTIDQLAEMGADPWEVTKALMAMKDTGSLEGAAETKAKYDAIIQASLTDEEKAVLVGTITGTDMLTEKGNPTQYAKFKIAIEGGMTVDEYLEFRKAGGSIDEYLDFAEAGLEPDDAADVALALDDLNPLDGKKHVSDLQKWRTCVDMFSSEATQLAALAGVMTEKQYQKVEIACDYSIGPAMYVDLRETLLKHDVDANGSLNSKEVTAAIDSMRGLTDKQKAVLWQLSVSSKSAKNNPYSSDVGQRVLDTMNKG